MEEGLLVKDLEAPYVLGERGRGLGYWVKMKPEYSDLTANLDVIVLGAYYSEGKRRSGKIASFLLGVAEPAADTAVGPGPGPGPGPGKGGARRVEEEEDEEELLLLPWANASPPPQQMPQTPPQTPTKPSTTPSSIKPEPLPPVDEQQQQQQQQQFKPTCFYTVGRCGSGITFQEWEELEKRLPFKPWPKGGRCPTFFKPWKPSRRDVPDFYVEPQDSVVLEVKCMAIEESDSFSSGFALR
jgi:ATP-dependent DNA ligase